MISVMVLGVLLNAADTACFILRTIVPANLQRELSFWRWNRERRRSTTSHSII
jgi:hypothetical protein